MWRGGGGARLALPPRMKKITIVTKKLTFHRESIRRLQALELAAAAGGMLPRTNFGCGTATTNCPSDDVC